MDTFNLIISGGCSGGVNMAADMFLLDRYKELNDFSSRPTLRLYYFSPPALSLGFFQKDKDIDKNIILKAKDENYDIVRRPTGGRAVLHKKEITYSVLSSYKNGIFAGRLIDTYKKVGEFLYLFFVKMGLKPDNGLPPDNKNKKETTKRKSQDFNCFLKAHSYEITFDRKKICGNSQRRNDTAFLQHGSIYIDYSPEEHIKLFENDNFNPNYFNNVTGLKQELNKTGLSHDLSFDGLAGILAKSFSETYNLAPLPASMEEIESSVKNNRLTQRTTV